MGSDPEILAALPGYWAEFDAAATEEEWMAIQARWLRAHGARMVDGELVGGLYPVRLDPE